MYRYLEIFLGESTKELWKAYKIIFPQDFQELVELGSNSYNFVNKVHTLLTGEDSNSGLVVF